MPKISIIMPTLNVKAFIKECMDSVVNQSLLDIEILVIDAGSTDGTLEIIEEYARNDSRVKIMHSSIKSYGYQLNIGIQMAIGKYVGVVETDDIIELDMYETLYNEAVVGDYDFVKGYGRRFWELKNGITYSTELRAFAIDKYKGGRIVFEGRGCGIELMRRDYYLWLGIYRNDFIKKIKLNETPGAAFQDIGFLAQAYFNLKKACYLDKCVYNYRQSNPNSSSVNKNGYRYIFDENNYLSSMSVWKDNNWKRACLIKAFKQADWRFRLMAYNGQYWSDRQDEIYAVVEMIKKSAKDLCISDYLIEDEKVIWDLLMESPYLVYEYYSKLYYELKEKKERFFDSVKGKRLIVFGCGSWGIFASFLIELFEVATIECFADNSSSLWGESVNGKNVIEPATIPKIIKDGICLIANKYFSDSIREQLHGYGIYDAQIVEYSLGINTRLLK